MGPLLLKEAWKTAVVFQSFVIPLRDKKPVGGLKWRGLVGAAPRWDAVTDLPWEDANQYGLILPDRVVVVDLDTDDGGTLHSARDELRMYPELKRAIDCNPFYVITRSGGRHFYFQLPEDTEGSNRPISDHIDMKALGGYVVGPGSPSYAWASEPPKDIEDLPYFPFFLALGTVH